jgi:hypothetical protein
MPNTDVVFLERIYKGCTSTVALVNKKSEMGKEKLRRVFVVAIDGFFQQFWDYLAVRDVDVDVYICRNKFLNMRLRHATETRFAMEKDGGGWYALKNRLMTQMYEVYEGFKCYLETGK